MHIRRQKRPNGRVRLIQFLSAGKAIYLALDIDSLLLTIVVARKRSSPREIHRNHHALPC